MNSAMDNDNKHDEAVSPAFHPTPTPKSDGSADTSADEDEINVIPGPSAFPVQSPVHFVLGNFFFATSLISLTIFTTFLVVTWFTVLRDARSMNHPAFSNATGVSQC